MAGEEKKTGPDEKKTEAMKTPTNQGTIANLPPPYDPSLPVAINIGGDVYQLNVDSSTNLSHRGFVDFQNTFRRYPALSLSEIARLFQKYLSLENGPTFSQITETDRQKLIRVLQWRRGQLMESKRFASRTVKSLRFDTFIQGIDELLEKLRTAVAPPVTPTLSEEQIMQLLLEFAWYLSHPDQSPAEQQESWGALVEQMKTQSAADAIENLLMLNKSNVQSIRGASTLKQARQLIRGRIPRQAVGSSESSSGQEELIKQLLNMLVTKEYLEKKSGLDKDAVERMGRQIMHNPMVEKEQKYNSGEDNEASSESSSTGYENVSMLSNSSSNASLSGGARTITPVSLLDTMTPIFDYLKSEYKTDYERIEGQFNQIDTKGILPHLLQLMKWYHHAYRKSQNPSSSSSSSFVYQFTDVPASLLYAMKKVIGVYTTEIRIKGGANRTQIMKLKKRIKSLRGELDTTKKQLNQTQPIQLQLTVQPPVIEPPIVQSTSYNCIMIYESAGSKPTLAIVFYQESDQNLPLKSVPFMTEMPSTEVTSKDIISKEDVVDTGFGRKQLALCILIALKQHMTPENQEEEEEEEEEEEASNTSSLGSASSSNLEEEEEEEEEEE